MLFRNNPELPELRSIICNNFHLGDFPFQIQGTAHSRESYPRCLRSLDSLVLDGNEEGLLEHYCFLGMQWRELELIYVYLDSATNLMQGSRLETLRFKARWEDDSLYDYEEDTDDDSEHGVNAVLRRLEDSEVHLEEFAAELRRHAGTLQELRLCGPDIWNNTLNLAIVRAVAVCAGLKHLVLTGDGWGIRGFPSPQQLQVIPIRLNFSTWRCLTMGRRKHCHCCPKGCTRLKPCAWRRNLTMTNGIRCLIVALGCFGTQQRQGERSVSFVGSRSLVGLSTGRSCRPKASQVGFSRKGTRRGIQRTAPK